MSETPESLIEFPAELSVKAMGLNNDEFPALVESIVTPFVPGDNAVTYTTVESRQAKYVAIRAHFTAQNIEQLQAIYAALRKDNRVLYIL